MKPRNDVVEMFASFLQFQESTAVWVSQLRLRRSMEKSLQNHSSPPTEGNFWALYWHQIWFKQPQTLAKEHLYAYLQETAYKAAYDQSKKVDSAQRWDKLQEYFQIGFKNQVYDHVLKRFNSQYGSGLAAFALPIFKNSIKEELRKANKAACHSNWSLLRRSSIKLWSKALEIRGLSSQDIESYLLLRDCFKALYSPKTAKINQKLSAPDADTWQAITQLYNQERLSQLSNSGQELSLQDIQERLEETAQAIRNYHNPQQISLNAPIVEQAGVELQDNISNDEAGSLLDDVIAQQEQVTISNLQQEIKSVLENALAEKVKPEQKQYLKLLYSQGLTQTEIAEQLLGDKKKQYKISRQINSGSQKLLKALVAWAKNQKTHNFDPDNIVDTVDILLKEWLQNYYANLRN